MKFAIYAPIQTNSLGMDSYLAPSSEEQLGARARLVADNKLQLQLNKPENVCLLNA